MDGCIADAGDGGKHSCPIDLLSGFPTAWGTFYYELWEIDLSCSDIALYSWNHLLWFLILWSVRLGPALVRQEERKADGSE